MMIDNDEARREAISEPSEESLKEHKNTGGNNNYTRTSDNARSQD